MREEYYSRYGKTVPGISYKLSACREALYGPLILITTGIITPDDPLAVAILDDWRTILL
jgi:Na+/H+ antiporter NhaD/arsenite permease-like protein